MSRSPGKVVVRWADGRVVKGYTYDFGVDTPRFHVVATEEALGEGTEVWLKDLKAVFFVRSFEGNPEYAESKDLDRDRPLGTRKVMVEFEDGELLVGYTKRYNPGGQGFFFFPMDPNSNNVRVFAVFAAVSSVRRLL